MNTKKTEDKPSPEATSGRVLRVVGQDVKPRLCVSFSGGRTSALMTRHCVEKYGATHDIIITFANTGCEHENTLKFVDQCDRYFGWNVVWIEAVFNMEHGKGVRAKVVNFETASRKGEPFLEYIKKNGLPYVGNPSCTRDLKDRAMHSYLKRDIGWKHGSYDTAIGIRSDEIDRVNDNYKKNRFIYPLADAGVKKADVITALKLWPFDLELESEAYGNCVWCWKKSPRKLLTLAKANPEIFDFPAEHEDEYNHHKLHDDEEGPRLMFRGHKTAKDIIKEANEKHFRPYRDTDYLQPDLFRPSMDLEFGCGASCEIGH